MELMAIDSLLTLVSDHHTLGRDAWVDATLVASALADAQEQPLWQALGPALETAGWTVEGSTQQTVPLSLLPTLMRSDAGLSALLDRRGQSLPAAAAELMDAWWQASLAAAGEHLVVLAATLSNDLTHRPHAQIHALTLPAPSWRWLVRAQAVTARLQRMTLRLDIGRYEALARTLAERAKPLRSRVQEVALEA